MHIEQPLSDNQTSGKFRESHTFLITQHSAQRITSRQVSMQVVNTENNEQGQLIEH
jgi:hypothetical protein